MLRARNSQAMYSNRLKALLDSATCTRTLKCNDIGIDIMKIKLDRTVSPALYDLQYITVRNGRGREMLESVRKHLVSTPTSSSGDRKPFVLATVESDDE